MLPRTQFINSSHSGYFHSNAHLKKVWNGTFYYTGYNSNAIYASADPKEGIWEQVGAGLRDYPDPHFFVDLDNRVYMIFGCWPLGGSPGEGPIESVELDPNRGFNEIGEPVTLYVPDPDSHGYEVEGDFNEGGGPDAWFEGAW